MVAEFKENMFSPKGAVILVIIIGVIIFLFFNFKEYTSEFWPGAKAVEDEAYNLKKAQKRLQNLLNQTNELEEDKQSFIRYARDFWIKERDGNKDTMVQRKIEDAARGADLKLSKIERVRSSKICDGVFFNDITITAKGQMRQIGNFIRNIYKTKPRLNWHTLTLRPDNQRAPKAVIMSGQLRFISITDEDLVEMVLK